MRTNLPVTQKEYLLREGASIVSRTDLKGRITYVNDDFIEASGFTEVELMGQPHNLLRHPDMPDAAFADLWRTVQAGNPWSGVVKNRRKNGDHYWVVANVTPLNEGAQVVGYLSVRTRPTQAQIESAARLYQDLRSGRAQAVLSEGEVIHTDLLARLNLMTTVDHRVTMGTRIALLLSVAVLTAAAAAWAATHPWGSAAWLAPLAGVGMLTLGALRMQRRLSHHLGAAAAFLEQFAQGRFEGIVASDGRDSVAEMMRAVRRVQTRLGFEFSDAKRRAQAAERIRQALDVATTNMMVADDKHLVVYTNEVLTRTLQDAEAEIRTVLPSFDVHALIGASLAHLSTDPTAWSLLLARLAHPATERCVLGARTFDLTLTPVLGPGQQRLGTVVEWTDVTATLAAQARDAEDQRKALAQQIEERRVAAENARVRQALDAAMLPVRIADDNGTIVYINEAMRAVLRRDEAAFRRTLPNFDASKVLGGSVGMFYTDPTQAIERLRQLDTTTTTRLSLGGHLYDVTTTPIKTATGERLGTVGQWDRQDRAAAGRGRDRRACGQCRSG